jgi:hypothetical protein
MDIEIVKESKSHDELLEIIENKALEIAQVKEQMLSTLSIAMDQIKVMKVQNEENIEASKVAASKEKQVFNSLNNELNDKILSLTSDLKLSKDQYDESNLTSTKEKHDLNTLNIELNDKILSLTSDLKLSKDQYDESNLTSTKEKHDLNTLNIELNDKNLSLTADLKLSNSLKLSNDIILMRDKQESIPSTFSSQEKNTLEKNFEENNNLDSQLPLDLIEKNNHLSSLEKKISISYSIIDSDECKIRPQDQVLLDVWTKKYNIKCLELSNSENTLTDTRKETQSYKQKLKVSYSLIDALKDKLLSLEEFKVFGNEIVIDSNNNTELMDNEELSKLTTTTTTNISDKYQSLIDTLKSDLRDAKTMIKDKTLEIEELQEILDLREESELVLHEEVKKEKGKDAAQKLNVLYQKLIEKNNDNTSLEKKILVSQGIIQSLRTKQKPLDSEIMDLKEKYKISNDSHMRCIHMLADQKHQIDDKSEEIEILIKEKYTEITSFQKKISESQAIIDSLKNKLLYSEIELKSKSNEVE